LCFLRFFNDVFLDTSGNKFEVGTENLFKHALLWRALRMFIIDELSVYCTQKHPVMTEEQEDFVFNGLFPVMTSILKTHYVPGLNHEATRTLNEITPALCAFVERSLAAISDNSFIGQLGVLLAALRGHANVPASLTQRVSAKHSSKAAGLEPHKSAAIST
jgi:hypothetical protein